MWKTAMDQKRPYLDVEDAAQALRFIMGRGHYDNRIYNVLTANATVREIVDIICAHIRNVQIEYVDTKIMNQLSYHVLSERFRALGFEFTGSLAKGIGQTIQLLRNARSTDIPGSCSGP